MIWEERRLGTVGFNGDGIAFWLHLPTDMVIKASEIYLHLWAEVETAPSYPDYAVSCALYGGTQFTGIKLQQNFTGLDPAPVPAHSGFPHPTDEYKFRLYNYSPAYVGWAHYDLTQSVPRFADMAIRADKEVNETEYEYITPTWLSGLAIFGIER